MQPFLTIWTNIRGTVRDVIDNKSLAMCFLFLIVGSLGSGLSGLQESGLDDWMSVWVILILSIVLIPIFVSISHFIYTAVIYLVGKLFKGTGQFWDCFKALSVSYIPFVVLIPVYLIWFLLDPTAFVTQQDPASFSTGSTISLIIISLFSIFCFVIQVIAVSEVHQFSIWRAIGTILIPGILFFLLIFVIIIVIIVAFAGLIGSTL